MQLWEGVRLAMLQLRSEKLKSFFGLLGVTLGVMFLITVVTVIEGMDRYIREDFSSSVFGVNTVTLRRFPAVNINTSREEWRERLRRPRITWDDVRAIRAGLDVPARVAVQNSTTRDVTGENGRAVTNVQVVGGSPEIFEVRGWNVERGRPFGPQEAEHGAAVVVLGAETADELFPGLDPLGRDVRVDGFSFRVIGVLEAKGSLFGESLDNQAVAPARSRIRDVTGSRTVVGQVIVQTLDPAHLREAQSELEGLMRTRHRLRPSEANDFSVETAEEALSFWEEISRVLFIAFPGLVAVALVVAGIVIMNIMLVSVMERTREIGVRKAIGARRRDILSQVLVESATLSTVGAAIGVGVGIGLASLVAALSPLPAAVGARWVVLGVALGVGVGIAAGVYPAARASKLDPVDALRYE